MEHLAIDLGGKESQICVRRSDGQIVEERRCRTAALAGVSGHPPAESRRGRDLQRSVCGSRMPHWPSGTRSAWCRRRWCGRLGVGARRLKTDRRDAQVLSEVSCRIDLPSVHVPSRQARERKTMCGMREALGGRPDEVGQHRARLAAGRGPTPAQRRAHHVRRSRPSALRRDAAPHLRRATATDASTSLNERDRRRGSGTRHDREGRSDCATADDGAWRRSVDIGPLRGRAR